jgi:GNAT superfamily N-acetyltransferase
MATIIRELTREDEILSLRPMVIEYFQIICGHLKNDFDVLIAPSDLAETMMETPEKFIPPSGRGYVVESDDDLIGMIFLKPLAKDSLEIKRLYLRKAARRQGLGRRLVRHVIEVARDLGTSDLYLDSIPSLKSAIALYEEEGFERIGPYGGSEIAAQDLLRPLGIYMHLSLNSQKPDTNC